MVTEQTQTQVANKNLLIRFSLSLRNIVSFTANYSYITTPLPPLFFLQYYIIDLCWQMPLKNDTLLHCLIKSLASWLRSEV